MLARRSEAKRRYACAYNLSCDNHSCNISLLSVPFPAFSKNVACVAVWNCPGSRARRWAVTDCGLVVVMLNTGWGDLVEEDNSSPWN
jgi:hypothetical protein